ncbi:MAG: hypothetical protein JW801_15805 [Bacteroidales bacterium]|nr:hypothetical protein [Bacteroidales bacterium]
MKHLTILSLFVLLFLGSCSYKKKITATNIRLSPVYSSGMILQTSPKTVLTGQASPGGILAVRIGEYVRMVKVSASGKWEVSFPEIKTKNPFSVKIQGSDTTIFLENVLPGRLFIVGGNAGLNALERSDSKVSYAPKSSGKEQTVRVFLLQGGKGKWYEYRQVASIPEVALSMKAISSRIHSEEYAAGIICVAQPAALMQTWLDPESSFQESIHAKDSTGKLFILHNETLLDSLIFLRDSARAGLDRRIGRVWYRDDSWKTTTMPGRFYDPVNEQDKRIAYFRKKILIPSRYFSSEMYIDLGFISGKAEYYFNEEQIIPEKTPGNLRLKLADSLTGSYSNMLLVRLFLEDSLSGFYGPEMNFYSADSGYFEEISRDWKFDRSFEKDFPEYELWLSEPSILFRNYLSALKEVRVTAAFWFDSFTEGSLQTRDMAPEILAYFNAGKKYILYPDLSALENLSYPVASKTRPDDLKAAARKSGALLICIH